MGVVQVGLPEELSDLIDRQVEAGRVESTDAYLAEAIRRHAEGEVLDAVAEIPGLVHDRMDLTRAARQAHREASGEALRDRQARFTALMRRAWHRSRNCRHRPCVLPRKAGGGAEVSTGLIALLDDVAGLAKVAAATLDDAAGQAARAGAKAAGVVIDDAAVTPTYVTGFAPSRELPIVGKIALGSLRNKLLYLLPAALLLSLVAPWAITPLLMAGGVYLCFEGAEKVLHALRPHRGAHTVAAAAPVDAKTLEDQKVRSAIQTDLILSAEIMAITLGAVPDAGFAVQATVLAVVGTGITGLVYGGVALIVKADDAGLALSRAGWAPLRVLGRGLVTGMPPFLRVLSVVGTAAMIWVGGGILLHGLDVLGLPGPAHWAHNLAASAGAAAPVGQDGVEWLVGVGVSGVLGLCVGAAAIPVSKWAVAPLVRLVRRTRRRSGSTVH